MTKQNSKKDQIIIYKTSNNEVDLKVCIKEETVWLDAHQMAKLFDVDRTGIVRHIGNIYQSSELDKNSTCAKIAQVAKDRKTRQMDTYNLDMIISVGYRVNSKQATKFRIWATSVLKKYLIQGYAINENRLKEAQEKFVELKNTIDFLAEKSKKYILKGQEMEILNLLKNYSKSFTFLEQYDKDDLPEPKGEKAKFILKYSTTKKIIEEIKKELMKKQEASSLFGQERGETFAGIIGNLYQTFEGNDLYPSVEIKAAHLLYFVIKGHPFSDGNKRSASFLFIYFLDRNNFLYKTGGERKINDNALTALALLVAVSDPKEKEIMIRLIINLIT